MRVMIFRNSCWVKLTLFPVLKGLLDDTFRVKDRTILQHCCDRSPITAMSRDIGSSQNPSADSSLTAPYWQYLLIRNHRLLAIHLYGPPISHIVCLHSFFSQPFLCCVVTIFSLCTSIFLWALGPLASVYNEYRVFFFAEIFYAIHFN